MKRRTSQPALPTAAIAAAMLLSISASADASLIASLMQTGQPSVSIKSSREGISDWFNRLSHAAHQIQHALHPDTMAPVAMTALRSPRGNHAFDLATSRLVIVEADAPPAAPVADDLTNLPPPVL